MQCCRLSMRDRIALCRRAVAVVSQRGRLRASVPRYGHLSSALIRLTITTPFFGLWLMTGCSTVPITGRTQLNMVSAQVLTDASDREFSKFMSIANQKNAVLSRSESSQAADAVDTVKRVSERIVDAAGLRGRYNWDTVVVKSNVPNAMVMPNGKIIVYTGLLSVAKTEGGLAAVLGHEVGHVLARHAAERMSQVLLAQLTLAVADVALAASNAKYQPVIGAAIGLGALYGVLMPFSRAHESEADRIGLLLMAKAGYDPTEAVGLWQRMQAAGGSSRLEFLSTHPSHATRVAQIQQWLPEAAVFYADGTRPLPTNLAELRAVTAERVKQASPVATAARASAAAGPPSRSESSEQKGEMTSSAGARGASPSLVPQSEPRPPTSEQHSWILGSWQAMEGMSGIVEGAGRFEFRRDGTQIKWRMVRNGWFSGVQTNQEASGSVGRISESSAELIGRYDVSNLGNVIGRPVRQVLTRDGDILRGYEAANDDMQSVLWLRKGQ